MESSDSVYNVKELIEEFMKKKQIYIPRDQQSLKFNDTALENNQTLRFYKIENKSNLQLEYRHATGHRTETEGTETEDHRTHRTQGHRTERTEDLHHRLPQGWVMRHDGKYLNRLRNYVQDHIPTENADDLPLGWSRQSDGKYLNRFHNYVQDHKPTENADDLPIGWIRQSDGKYRIDNHVQDQKPTDDLPRGWVKRISKSEKHKGRPYYFNITTKESVWEKPTSYGTVRRRGGKTKMKIRRNPLNQTRRRRSRK